MTASLYSKFVKISRLVRRPLRARLSTLDLQSSRNEEQEAPSGRLLDDFEGRLTQSFPVVRMKVV